ncbi:MAG: PEP-CTERM sorting domain-containing protein [Verrucomicrobiales bacterium]|nr:PEP-CTERM sorting domain-containing protein [Verrucomicrobiales bacterium]
MVVATGLMASFSAHSAAVYTSLSSFNAAIQGGAYFEDFEGLAAGPLDFLSTYDFSGGTGPIQYTASANVELYVAMLPDSSKALTTIQFNNSLVLSFTTPNITAVGGEFFLLDGNESPANGTISVTLNDGSTSSFDVNSHASGSLDYLGFTTTAPNYIQSITLNGVSGQYSAVNNLTVGFAAVPEPAVMASLAGLGLLGFGLARRWRRSAGLSRGGHSN